MLITYSGDFVYDEKNVLSYVGNFWEGKFIGFSRNFAAEYAFLMFETEYSVVTYGVLVHD